MRLRGQEGLLEGWSGWLEEVQRRLAGQPGPGGRHKKGKG